MNQENLKKHVNKLYSILNENDIIDEARTRFMKDGQNHDWKCDNDPKSDFGGAIACDSSAFNFLKQNGHIDIGVCWKCGEEPIDDSYQFTDGSNPSIKYYICSSCYNGGKRLKNDFGIKNESSDSNCYIATMCYGDINAPQVHILRNYRDEVLSKSIAGKAFVQMYYKTSPRIVRIMKNKTKLNQFIRKFVLDKIIKYIKTLNSKK